MEDELFTTLNHSNEVLKSKPSFIASILGYKNVSN